MNGAFLAVRYSVSLIAMTSGSLHASRMNRSTEWLNHALGALVMAVSILDERNS